MNTIKFSLALGLTLGFGLHGFGAQAVAGSEKLTVAKVKSLTMQNSLDVQVARKKASRSEVSLTLARGVYDFNLLTTAGYEYSRAESLTGTVDPLQRTFLANATLAKKFSTGTLLAFAYDQQFYSDDLDVSSTSSSSSSKEPKKYLQAASLKVNQALWRNVFGFADRLNEDQAQSDFKRAQLQQEEDIEAALLANLTIFWNAVVAQELVRADDLVLDKYDQLVRNVRKKSTFSLLNPGELPQLEAEALAYKAQFDAAKQVLVQRLDELKAALNIAKDVSVELAADLDLDSAPQLIALDERGLADLRALRIYQQDVTSKETASRKIASQTDPRLDLVLKARSVGVDRQSSEASQEMLNGGRPDYFVGVEFETPLWGRSTEAAVADASLNYQLAQLELQRQELKLRSYLHTLQKSVLSDHQQADYAVRTEELRSKALRELESAYRQGRQSLREVIRAYGDVLKAQNDRAKFVGQFKNRLNEWLAATDQLK